MSAEIKDFDQAVAEVEERWVEFKYGGEMFKVDLNIEAGPVLKWMELGSKLESIPQLLHVFLDDADYDRLLATNAGMPQALALVEWFAEEMAGQGNAQP